MSLEIESQVRVVSMEAIADYGDNAGVISPDLIRASGRGDSAYVRLVDQIGEGFPSSRRMTDPLIRDFWEVRHRLSVDDGLVLLDRRIVVPVSLRKRVLRCLHSAHQGVAGMKSRANETVYWPGMDASLRNHRESCETCNRVAPSLPREPLVLSKSPEWPFQHIAADTSNPSGSPLTISTMPNTQPQATSPVPGKLNPHAPPFPLPEITTGTDIPVPGQGKLPRALTCLAPYNNPGLQELNPSTRSTRRTGGERGESEV